MPPEDDDLSGCAGRFPEDAPLLSFSLAPPDDDFSPLEDAPSTRAGRLTASSVDGRVIDGAWAAACLCCFDEGIEPEAAVLAPEASAADVSGTGGVAPTMEERAGGDFDLPLEDWRSSLR